MTHQIQIEFNNEVESLDFDNTCVLNIRGGEYKKYSKFNLQIEYWKQCIEIMKAEHGVSRFIIVTDDIRYTTRLLPDIETLNLSVEQCFQVLFNCKYFILSNSTFSYFPISLANKTTKRAIIAPAYFSRPYNKNKLWCSPCNVYRDWNYYDCIYQRILTTEEIKSSVSKTLIHYAENLNLRIKDSRSKNTSQFKRLIKWALLPILKKLFPLKF